MFSRNSAVFLIGLLMMPCALRADDRLAFDRGFIALVSSRLTQTTLGYVRVLAESKGEKKWDELPEDFKATFRHGLEYRYSFGLIACDGPLGQVDKLIDWSRNAAGEIDKSSTSVLIELSIAESLYWPLIEAWYVKNFQRILSEEIAGDQLLPPKCVVKGTEGYVLPK